MDSDQFPTSPVPAERSIPWWKIALTNVLFSICLPTLITGLDLGIAAPRRYFLSGIVVGSLILTFIGTLTSVLGSRTRLSSYMLARIAFGTHGSTLLNLVFALSLLGWFGVNINLFGDAMARLIAALWGYTGPVWPVELVAGLMMMLTTLVGLRAINTLSTIIVPVLAAVCLLMLWESLKHGSVGNILARAPLEGLSFGDTVSSVVGGFVVGAVIMPDTCRFIEKPRGAVWTAVLTYFVSSVIVTLIGGVAALATGKVEILGLMLFAGFGRRRVCDRARRKLDLERPELIQRGAQHRRRGAAIAAGDHDPGGRSGRNIVGVSADSRSFPDVLVLLVHRVRTHCQHHHRRLLSGSTRRLCGCCAQFDQAGRTSGPSRLGGGRLCRGAGFGRVFARDRDCRG